MRAMQSTVAPLLIRVKFVDRAPSALPASETGPRWAALLLANHTTGRSPSSAVMPLMLALEAHAPLPQGAWTRTWKVQC